MKFYDGHPSNRGWTFSWPNGQNGQNYLYVHIGHCDQMGSMVIMVIQHTFISPLEECTLEMG